MHRTTLYIASAIVFTVFRSFYFSFSLILSSMAYPSVILLLRIAMRDFICFSDSEICSISLSRFLDFLYFISGSALSNDDGILSHELK